MAIGSVVAPFRALAPQHQAGQNSIAKVAGASCLLGKWNLTIGEITFNGKVLERGGSDTEATFSKAPGFGASGPVIAFIDYNDSEPLYFANNGSTPGPYTIRTKTIGTFTVWLRVVHGRLIFDGHITQATTQTEQINLNGTWQNVAPTEDTQPTTGVVPKFGSFAGFSYTCAGRALHLTDTTTTVQHNVKVVFGIFFGYTRF